MRSARTFSNFPLVFGGHPAITPFVRTAADRIAHDLAEDPELTAEARLKTPEVVMFQSRLFFDREAAPDELLTPPLDRDGNEQRPRNGWRNESLLLMRYEMLGLPVAPQSVNKAVQAFAPRTSAATAKPAWGRANSRPRSSSAAWKGCSASSISSAPFIPTRPSFPIASTGSACKLLFGEMQGLLPPPYAASLERETTYSLLMQQILPLSEPAAATDVLEAGAGAGALPRRAA